ncbi:MAG: 3-hydroxyacyl-CoA dehydrogenase family protein [Planctomycetaceae bacterium]
MSVTNETPVAVIGLGTMGHGIAQAFAVGGYPVRGFDEQPASRSSAVDRIAGNLEQLTEAGLIEEDAVPDVLGRITVCESLEETVAGAGFVTEAAWEDLAVKQELFGKLEALVSPGTILASNSSSFKISETARDLDHPERAVVTHWFNPPHVIPVVEVVGGERTSEATVTTAVEMLEGIGKMAVRVDKELTGFLVNRVQVAMMREIWDLLDRGVATAAEIDRAIRGSMGLRLAALGPLAISDYAGWDIATATFENLVQDMRGDTEIPGRIRQLVEDGQLGAKTGQGLFSYPAEELPGQLARRDADYLALVRLLHGGSAADGGLA